MSYTLAAFADEAGSSLTAQIAALQRNGIGLLEIRGVDGKSIADVDAGEAKEIAKRLADAGLAVRSIGSPYGKIGINDDFGPHFEKFRRTLEVAGILGASYMRIFSFFIPAGSEAGCVPQRAAALQWACNPRLPDAQQIRGSG